MREQFDGSGLPTGDDALTTLIDLCAMLDERRDGEATLFGVLTPAATSVHWGQHCDAVREQLARTQADGVLHDVVLAAAGTDPWQLVWGQCAPQQVAAVALVWQAWHHEQGREPVKVHHVAAVTRSGVKVAVARRGHGTLRTASSSSTGALSAALSRMLDVPATFGPVPVSAWLGRHLAHQVARLENVTAEIVHHTAHEVLDAAGAQPGRLPQRAAAIRAARWWDLDRTAKLMPKDVREADGWVDAGLLSWLCADQVGPQVNALEAVTSRHGVHGARALSSALHQLGWSERTPRP